MKFTLVTSFIAGFIMICMGVFFHAQGNDSSGMFKIGGLALFSSMVLWFISNHRKNGTIT